MKRPKTRPSRAAPIQTSGRTQIVGIIGDPVAHSLSPAMHNAAFRALRLDFTYVAFRVSPAQLAAAVAAIRALQIAGMNVTVPHKEHVVEFLDSVSATSRRAGAVNTIINRNGRLHGENTDVVGFRRALAEAGVDLNGARVLLIGAGGVARAVLTALADGGANAVFIANRTLRRAQHLAGRFNAAHMPAHAVPLAALRDTAVLHAVDLIVNATSVGLRGERFVPISYGATARHCVFIDLLYGPRTDFLTRAARAGRPRLDGRSMLLHQGAAAFALWTRRRAPLDVMRAALAAATRQS